MNKAEIASVKKRNACLHVCVDVCFVVKGLVTSNKIRPVEQGSGRPENIEAIEEQATADVVT
jgi:hypothetical protein